MNSLKCKQISDTIKEISENGISGREDGRNIMNLIHDLDELFTAQGFPFEKSQTSILEMLIVLDYLQGWDWRGVGQKKEEDIYSLFVKMYKISKETGILW